MTKNIKLAMHTADLSDEKFLALQDLFPEAVTETIITDENGERVVTRAIDAEVLQQLINKKVVSGKEERYQFTWPDKKKTMLLANAPINKTLRPCREESVDFDNTENLYIEGDNLDVLKLLRETYLGKIKMIYIDPPYNTGNDFVYEDDFAEDTQEFLRRDNQIDEHGNRLVTNTESNGRLHTDWLNMMYPRLKLARDLLTEDGYIFISIDDNECDNLLKICNELFGQVNHVGTFKWNRTVKAPSLSNSIRIKFEYVICFKKNEVNPLKGKQSYNKQAPLLHLPNKQAEVVFPKGSFEFKVEKSFEPGKYSDKYKVELIDSIINKNGTNENKFRLRACFAWNQAKINDYISKGYKFEVKKDLSTIYYTLDNNGGFIAPSDLISDDECGVKRNTEAKEELRKLGIDFDYSKPVSLIKYLIKMCCYNTRDAIILDFFSGSSTTAHAVMELNVEDGNSHKFIMVQLPEKTDENSEAYKTGFHDICEIGKERIKRAGNKIKEEMGLTAHSLDIGFRVLKLDESNMNNVFYSPDEYKETNFKFEDLIENVKPGRTHEDILFQVMLELGVPLSAKINIDDNIITVDGNYLVACFETVDTDTVTRIAKMKPYYAVFRDSSFINDSSLINVDQIFNTYSPTTKRRVI